MSGTKELKGSYRSVVQAKFPVIPALAGVLFCLAAMADPEGQGRTFSSLKRDDGSSIRFDLNISSPSRSDTLLIGLQGSDCNSVIHGDFIRVHAKEAWPTADLLVVEKAGITADLPYSPDPERPDCPASYIQQDSPERRVQALRMVVNTVMKDREYKRVIALGGSEGAVIAAMFATETGLPSAVVLINGGGRWFADDVLHNIRATSPPERRQSDLESFQAFTDRVLNGGPFDIEVSNHGYRWWRSVLTIDLQSVLSRITVPVLIVQGGRDKSVSPRAVEDMVEALSRAGRSNIELMLYPDLDHGLTAPNGERKTGEVIRRIRSWLETHLRNN